MQVTRHFRDTERYEFDFGMCRAIHGWSQLDTEQDAPYYGTWANPYELKIINYAEGDITIRQCDNEREFRSEIMKWFFWNIENGWNPEIDCMGHADKWKELGFKVNDIDLILAREQIKTYRNWKHTLEDYLVVGDEVDEEMYSYAIEVLPPATFGISHAWIRKFGKNCTEVVQIGEPYRHNEDSEPMYETFYQTRRLIDGKAVTNYYYAGILTTAGKDK